MIDPTRSAAAAATTTGGTPAKVAASAKSTKSFAGELAKSVKKVERPDGEQTRKVAGHPYSRIENGRDEGLYVNQVEGGPREGAVFRLVERGDRVFHVYGSGRDKLIIGLRTQDRSDGQSPAGTPSAQS